MDTEHLQLVREHPRNVGERAITPVPNPDIHEQNATEVWPTIGFDKSGKMCPH
jgi:hypothetical protein